jgi:hypothetical protein
VLPNHTATAATFNSPVVVSGTDASEPGIEVAPDGTLYVHAPTGIPLWSSMWRSTNAGANWTALTSATRASLGGGDIDMAIQTTPPALAGKLLFTDLWLGSSTVGTSTDKGNTWLQNDLQGVVAQDRQWVQTTGNDVAYHVTHQLASGLWVSKSLDGGLTYPIHVLAASTLDQGNCICPPGYMIAEPGNGAAGTNDKVGVIYTTATGVNFSRSLNGGLTWARSTVDPTGGASTIESFPVVANAGGNNLVAVWMENTGSSSRIMAATSGNWGATWNAPYAIVNTGTSVFPWVDARGGHVAVTLYHTTATGGPDNVANSAQWFIKYLDTDGLLSGSTLVAQPAFTALTTADATAVKTGPICTDGINCSADRELGDFQMVALDANVKANISYVRSIDGNFNTEIRYVRQA